MALAVHLARSVCRLRKSKMRLSTMSCWPTDRTWPISAEPAGSTAVDVMGHPAARPRDAYHYMGVHVATSDLDRLVWHRPQPQPGGMRSGRELSLRASECEGKRLAVVSPCSMTDVFIAEGGSRRNATVHVPTKLGSSTLMTWPAFAWQVQILFSNSVMVSTSACWLSAMFLASVIASGFLPEPISAWAILIAPW